MKKFLVAFLLLGSFALLGGTVFAQETDNEIAAKYGVTFPIPELGNCGGLSECRTYCEDPVNQDSCIAYAKSKGFYKEEEFEVDESVVKKAKASLGCDSISSCREFCSQEENFGKCHRFAQNSELVGGYTTNPESREILKKAKEVLGCDSYTSCKNFCENPAKIQ